METCTGGENTESGCRSGWKCCAKRGLGSLGPRLVAPGLGGGGS